MSYLNALPFNWGLTRGSGRGQFDLTLAPPAECARLLADGLVDAALIPSIEFARISGLTPIHSLGISSIQEVRSVLLVTGTSPEKIQRVAVDLNSRTSVALLRLVLARKYGCRPQFVAMQPELGPMLDGNDAALLIGDAALRASHENQGWPVPGDGAAGLRVLDLAREWNEMTRMPFVFALWACRPVVAVRDVSAALHLALDEGLAHLEDISKEESARTGLPEEMISSYLRFNIGCRLGKAESDSLRFFFRLCRDEGILAAQAVSTKVTAASIKRRRVSPGEARLS